MENCRGVGKCSKFIKEQSEIKVKERIYVCHTFYHVYVSFLKEMNLPIEKRGKATLVISHMSTDFGDFSERVRKSGFFEEVVDFDEKHERCFPELAKYRQKEKNFIKSTLNRIKFTKKFARLQAEYIPVDFKQYRDIYVFCDSDPIGFYLNANHIYYHAVEDGLNCLKNGDLAHLDNLNHFKIKAFLSQKCNLIFIQNGYSKYCIDMEVNDISVIAIPFEKYVEVPRKKLVEGLRREDKDLLLKVFVPDIDKLKQAIQDNNVKTALVLTEPLCPDLSVRKQIFEDIVERYKDEYMLVFKPHPRDELDYKKEFPDYQIIDKVVPMEMLNFIEGCKMDLAIGVFTELDALEFVKDRVRLGADFMDKYEDPSIHRFPDLTKCKH